MDGISVIVPIYNVEDYISECLSSILVSMKDLPNIQVILIDDGSKDSSSDIALKFVNEHTNFEYIRKENGGLSDARNFGLKLVKYDYISFIDSDDFIAEDYFSSILQEMKSKPDMIVFDWLDVHENNESNLVKGMDLRDCLWSVQPSAWNKVYNKKLFDEIKFPKGKLYEDVGTIYKLLDQVSTYKYLEKPLYKYRKNRGGSLLTTISPKINDIYEMLEDTYAYYERNGRLDERVRDGLCYQYIKLLMWSNMYRQLKYYKLNFIGFHSKMKMTKELINERFDNWASNPYLEENADYFISRYGSEYIRMIEYIGKNVLYTFYSIQTLVLKNIKRK